MTTQPPFRTSKRQTYFVESSFFASLSIFLHVFLIFLAENAHAGFASQLSISLREEFNDNIFFEKNKESDFITSIIPTFTLLYAPPGQTIPVFTASLAPQGQIYARNPEETNFGDNVSLNAGYTYYHSPRLTVHLSDSLARLGNTRIGELGGFGNLPPPTSLPPSGSVIAQPSSQQLGGLVANGQQFSNQLSMRGVYTLDPNVSVVGDSGVGFRRYLDLGGNDISYTIGARGIYKWREEHNFHLGYGVNIIRSRAGNNNTVHNIDVGDDYFSNFQIKLAPTLTITALSGIALNAGGNGPSIANRSNITITKLWERATLDVGLNKGLTPSFGVSGISDTTSFSANLSARLTELLTMTANVNYSLFDTEDGKFRALIGSAGVLYQINRWLASSVQYSYRLQDASSGAASTGVLTGGRVNSNSIALAFTALFNLWPNLGLGQQP